MGDSGIKAARAGKEETTLQPGRIFGKEGSVQRRAVGALNPSVDMPRDVHVNNQARVSVKANTYSELSRTEVPAYRKLQQAFEAEKPAYTGPKGRPLAGTWADYAENPSLYAASDALTAVKNALRDVQLANLNKLRGEFNADVGWFQGADPEAVYIPHIASADDLDKAVQSTVQSISSRGSVGKTRAYDSLSDRVAKQPGFKPELDAGRLGDVHAQSLSSIASSNTFKDGLGKTRLEVMAELHPKLATRMDGLRKSLQSLKGTAGRLDDRVSAAVDNFLASPMEDVDLAALRDNLDVKVGANAVGKEGVNFGKTPRQMQAEIVRVRAELKKLQPYWKSAGVGDYTFNRQTFRYHTPAESQAIDSILRTKANTMALEGGLQVMDEALAFGLGPDFSPLTIQGMLGAASHPEVLLLHGKGIAHAAVTGDIFKNLDQALIKRYEFASGRPFGQVGSEFRKGGKGLERLADLPGGKVTMIPRGIGRGVAGFNDALMRAREYGMIRAFENDANILRKLNPKMSQVKADAEAMSTLSKTVPARMPAETGRSTLRARMERAPVISTSFIASPFELAKDMTSGAAKLVTRQKLSGREQLALFRGIAMGGSFMGTSIASALIFAEANHMDPVEAVMDVVNPGSGHFMSLILPGGRSFGLGGPFRSAIRAFAPGWRDGKFVPFAGGNPISFGQAKLNPIVGTSVDIARNKDYRGNQIYSGRFDQRALAIGRYIAENSNLVIGAALEPGRTGRGDVVTGIGSQIAGVNYREPTPSADVRRLVREDVESGKLPQTYTDADGNEQRLREYGQLTKEQQRDFDERHGKAVQAKQEGQPEPLQAIRRETAVYTERQQQIDALGFGQAWRDARSEAKTEQRGALNAVERQFKEYFDKLDKRDPVNIEDAALDEYFRIIDNATDAKGVNWERVDREVAGMDPKRQAALAEYKLIGSTPKEEEYRHDIAKLDGYFNIRDEAWRQVSKDDPKLAKYETLDDYRAYLVDGFKKQAGLSNAEAEAMAEKLVTKYADLASKVALNYLKNHPELVSVLDKHGYYVNKDLRPLARPTVAAGR